VCPLHDGCSRPVTRTRETPSRAERTRHVRHVDVIPRTSLTKSASCDAEEVRVAARVYIHADSCLKRDEYSRFGHKAARHTVHLNWRGTR
jgi:hypothetical protein